jgi:hypothetical protein
MLEGEFKTLFPEGEKYSSIIWAFFTLIRRVDTLRGDRNCNHACERLFVVDECSSKFVFLYFFVCAPFPFLSSIPSLFLSPFTVLFLLPLYFTS